jgi:hypothetical protein
MGKLIISAGRECFVLGEEQKSNNSNTFELTFSTFYFFKLGPLA